MGRLESTMDKGTLSNLISASLLGAGLALPAGPAQAVVLSTGMFAFSGGITNTLAIKMLFDRVPGLIGSGVIPARFREIRAKIRQLIITHFFDPAYLRQFFQDHREEFSPYRYLKPRNGDGGLVSTLIDRNWEKIASPRVIQPIVDRQLEKLMDSSIGGMLILVGVDTVKPAVTQFVTGLVSGLKGKVLEISATLENDVEIDLDEDKILAEVRETVDRLLEAKLQLLDATTVKRMLEDVIRSHLGWLVVWGNVFGGLLGLVAVLVR